MRSYVKSFFEFSAQESDFGRVVHELVHETNQASGDCLTGARLAVTVS